MSHLIKTMTAGLLCTAIAGAACGSQAVPANTAKPGVQIQAPGVKIETTRMNVQVPIAVAQIGVPAGGRDDGIGEAGYYTRNPWFSNPGVREELKLNDDQYTTLNRHYERAWVQYNRDRNVIDSSLNLQKQAMREAELRRSFERTLAPAVTTTITDPVARDRYNQLYAQYRGYSAFLDPTVVEQLELTPEQQQKFAQLNAEWAKQTANWRTDYPANRETVVNQLRDSRQTVFRNIDSTLTPAQRARWNKLMGKPYEFHPDVYLPSQTKATTLKPPLPEPPANP